MSDRSARIEAAFGAWFRNTMASEDNPTRDGMFVRVVRIPRGQINAGTWWEMTDGKGEFWKTNPDNAAALATPEAPAQGWRCIDCGADVTLRFCDACRERVAASIRKDEKAAREVLGTPTPAPDADADEGEVERVALAMWDRHSCLTGDHEPWDSVNIPECDREYQRDIARTALAEMRRTSATQSLRHPLVNICRTAGRSRSMEELRYLLPKLDRARAALAAAPATEAGKAMEAFAVAARTFSRTLYARHKQAQHEAYRAMIAAEQQRGAGP